MATTHKYERYKTEWFSKINCSPAAGFRKFLGKILSKPSTDLIFCCSFALETFKRDLANVTVFCRVSFLLVPADIFQFAGGEKRKDTAVGEFDFNYISHDLFLTSSTSPKLHRLGVQKSFWGHRKFTGFSQEKQYMMMRERVLLKKVLEHRSGKN